MRLSIYLLALLQGVSALVLGNGGRAIIRETPDLDKRDLLQDLVTWDEKSLFVRGERIMIFSGEFHPFRLPVPSLWADVFEKIKALGFNCVSFYVDWAVHEGKPGEFRADGVFAWEPFFKAATEAGIWLIARPGPYINAEVSGGGFPGWLQRVKGVLRTSDADYLAATDNYMANINAIIAKAQITNGGPVILYQPENEYSGAVGVDPFPQPEYMAYVENQARKAGIVVPLINNDAWTGGKNAPGTGEGEVDIYGHDSYPLGFDCAKPTTWPAGKLPTYFRESHLEISPKTPYTIPEFQGGSFDPYGGLGFAQCSELVNHEFVRVFYKNNMAAQVAIFNVYMTFGGTNWGYMSHAGGYSSYDYGAVIEEDGRKITREKYSELKLEAQFLKVSPDYLVSEPARTNLTGVYSTNTDITITPLLGRNGTGSFFVVRHTDYSNLASTKYTLRLPTAAGNKTIPQLGGSLSLNGRDSKVHVADYPFGDFSLQYSTAEVFTWKKFHDKTVLVLYGGPGELHEFAVTTKSAAKLTEGDGVTTKASSGTLIAQWTASSKRRVLQIGNLHIYLLDRNTAYNYWVPDLPSAENGAYGTSHLNPESVIVAGGYLVRSVEVSKSTLAIRGDFNSSTSIEVIGAPKGANKLTLNGSGLKYKTNSLGNWVATATYSPPKLAVPELKKLAWKVVDSLPEIDSGYDDSNWPAADHTTSNNTLFPLKMPVSLYGSDYGFHAGVLVMRGHFTASGVESSLYLSTQGGFAFGSTVFLDDQLLGSWKGIDADAANNSTYTLPTLTKGRKYTLTVLCDNTGLDGNWVVGPNLMKAPRGIINYALTAKDGSETKITDWKITGNLGGEDYLDKERGPLNEGGMWFERHGLHLPGAPTADFKAGSPYDGFDGAGVKYYTADLKLDFPSPEYDIPVSFVIENSTTADAGAYRAFLYVNGWMFGRYVSNVGPQTKFPVPEGILDYSGTNTIGLAVWALEDAGAKVPGFYLNAGTPMLTSRKEVEMVEANGYEKRDGVY